MSSISKKSRSGSRLTAFLVTVALLLCALLPFAFIYSKPTGVSAEDEPAAQTDNGIRFVQVAAGEHFAIGLTYDGDLYGWSLDKTATGTLGADYPEHPQKIGPYRGDVSAADESPLFKFVQGPAGGSWDRDGYHTYVSAKDEKIVSIAATRYTAAFLTQNGYIYTWGYDNTHVDDGHSSAGHYLLLRNDNYPQNKPYMIDYGYTENQDANADALSKIKPPFAVGSASLAAGEYNYIFAFAPTATIGLSGANATYIWGSTLYRTYNGEKSEIVAIGHPVGTSNQDHYIYRLPAAYSSAVTAVGGGYNVGYNAPSITLNGDKTSLSLRGRNFLTNKAFVDSNPVYSYKISKISNAETDKYTGTSKLAYNVTEYPYLIAGDYKTTTASGSVIQIDDDVNGDNVYGRLATGEGEGGLTFVSYATDSTSNISYHIMNSAGNAISTDNNIKLQYNAVSLGNDVGYGIDLDGNLYGWGDGTEGQLPNLTGDTSYPRRILSDKNDSSNRFITVAAGKQLSNTPAFSADGHISGGAFIDGVKNKTQFITGALTQSGELYVWSDAIKGPKKIIYADQASSTDGNKFAAVYSGYGNNLFAVTRLGKLVRITYNDDRTGYEQTIYEKFISEPGNKGIEITNWTVSTAQDNLVRFMVDPETKEYEPALGTFTIYAGNGYADLRTVIINGDESEYLPRTTANEALSYAAGSLVDSNAIGDVYRILDYKRGAADAKTFIDTTGTLGGNRSLSVADITPTFEFNGVALDNEKDKAQIDNLFAYDISYHPTYGVGIKISPKRSSKGGEIAVKFIVARYDCANNFTTSGTGIIKDTALYYDYRQCAVKFIVDDTPTQRNQFDYRGEEREGNSYIPLLDPNNTYNDKFSVAIEDVSQGVIALADFLTGGYGTDLAADIKRAMKSSDIGYPDKDKINKGHLTYYLNSDDLEAYNKDAYMFLIKDRDGDDIRLQASTLSKNSTAADGAIESVDRNNTVSRTISISIPVKSSYGIDPDMIENKTWIKSFLNIYGLHDIDIVDDVLTFNYDVLTFVAKKGTGRLDYGSNKVNDYKTGSNSDHFYTNIRTNTRNIFDANYAPIGAYDIDNIPSTSPFPYTFDTVTAVYSQPSIRLTNGPADIISRDIYGDSTAGAAHNTFDITYDRTITVGSSATINLESYISNLGADMGTSSNIYFSYNGKRTNDDYNAFNKLFADELGGGDPVVTLSERTITIKPTTRRTIKFTVVAQRFWNNNTDTFGADETITFNITVPASVISDFSPEGGLKFELNTTATTTYSINQDGSFNILGGGTINVDKLINCTAGYESAIDTISWTSTDQSVLKVARSSDSMTFNVTTLSSGVSTVQVVATLFGNSIIITLRFEVTGNTQISDVIELVDTSTVYMSGIINILERNNNFKGDQLGKYNVLYNDVNEDGSFNAIYFTKDTPSGEIVEKPAFIKEIGFIYFSTDRNTPRAGNPQLRIELDKDVFDTSGTYYIHIKYIDTVNNPDINTYAMAEDEEHKIPVIESTQKITSNKKILRELDPEKGGQVFTIEVDCDSPVAMNTTNPKSNWYTDGVNTNMTVRIPVYMLISTLKMQDTDSTIGAPEHYEIFLVSASVDASKYFNYTVDEENAYVLITPLYDTPEPITINVAVRPTGDGDENARNLVLTFRISTKGISTELDKGTYITIWLVAFFASFGFLFIIFLIRMIVYWRRRAKQRALIKRNQELIKMRDRIHSKTTAATREQIVKTKMKMEDPKYAKMFNEMKKEKGGASGVTVENTGDFGTDDGKKKKKKGGKKSIAELKAELEAKKAAYAQAQSGGTVNPFGAEQPPQGFGGAPNDFGSPADAFAAQDLNAESIIFDSSEDGSQM